MLLDRVSNPGPLAYESGALPIALRGPAQNCNIKRLVVVKPPETTSARPVNVGQ